MKLAPIVLFAYNRPLHTRKTLEALAANYLAEQSELYVFADGPKANASTEDIARIEEVRSVIKERKWCARVELIESQENKGLAKSVIHGITQIVNQFGTIIVLEDDLISSPWFLTYMNEGLNLYKHISNVYSVNGYMFPVETNRIETVLLPYTSTWGWGTWKEKWEVFEINPVQNKIIGRNNFLRQRFNLADYDYTSMLINAKNSWGIHWYFSVFIRNGLGVFPTKSLIENIGFDSSGVNCGPNQENQSFYSKRIKVIKTNTIDLEFFNNYFAHFLKSVPNSSSEKRLLRKIKNRLNWVRRKIL